jgi:nicotinate-nucleotide pyrophosphorylase (carboxylating)
MKLVKEKLQQLIMNSLKEDIGEGDITTTLVFEKDAEVIVNVVAREDCIVAGVELSKWIFQALYEKVSFTPLFQDGDEIKKNKKIFSVKGSLKNILAGERVVLNFLGHLSGVATLTAQFVEKVKGTKAKIFDTRKTMPGLRELEKYAVKEGGGYNHRMGLWDGVLVKDSHLESLMLQVKGSKLLAIDEAIKGIRAKGFKNIEVEVDNLEEFKEALDTGADIILLDNMSIEDIKKAVKIRNTKANSVILEVSGGITLENVRDVAKTGVERISIGCLTHSAPSIDFSMEICK